MQYTIASRQNRAGKQNVVVIDLLENKGIKEAVSGKEIIFHLATDLKRDTEATQNLLGAIDPNSKVHLIYISVVGTDKVPFAYYRQKLGSEEAVKRSGIPYTILRATQFHEFIDQILSTFKIPDRPAPQKDPAATDRNSNCRRKTLPVILGWRVQ
ncbi:SDR family oxidoreductase [Chryseobacterium arachidis]|uniref:SDR family oxidoreductase n=1 Tax=Chryseobacterium arachidis TaxID=1416778 RepID=UPI0036195A0A